MTTTKRKQSDSASEANGANERDHSTISKLHMSHDPYALLQNMPRLQCPQCGHNYKFFCYKCMVPFEPLRDEEIAAAAAASGGEQQWEHIQREDGKVIERPLPRPVPKARIASRVQGEQSQIPLLNLPIRCVIIQHPNEVKGKSTAIHAKLLAPGSVDIFQFPDQVPTNLFSHENSLLLYPSADALSVSDVVRELLSQQAATQAGSVASAPVSAQAPEGIKYIIFIDSTWQQSKAILRDERLAPVRRVKIETRKTCFWRYQQHGESFLSTMEAIYFFYREFAMYYNAIRETGGIPADQSELERFYRDEMDDLLFYFVFMYRLIQDEYKNDQSKEFKRISNWVKYDKNGQPVQEENEAAGESEAKRPRTE